MIGSENLNEKRVLDGTYGKVNEITMWNAETIQITHLGTKQVEGVGIVRDNKCFIISSYELLAFLETKYK